MLPSPMHRLPALVTLLVALSMPVPAQAQDSLQVIGGPGDAAAAGSVETPATPPPPPPPCGTQPIGIARMQWPSAALLAEIHMRVLKANFGCDARLIEGDLAATGSSMGATGQPAVAPEMWVTRIADIWNADMKGQTVRQAGLSYADTVFEGWFVPDYAVASWPELTSIDGIKAHADAFAEGGGKPKVLSCPADWGCAVINRNLLRAYGLDQVFDVVEPANRFEMDTLIAEAVGRKQPILFYYWQPNAVLSQFAFQPVTLASYDRDAFQCMGRTVCALPAATGFAPEPVVIALAEWVYLDAPQVAAYFQRAHMPFAEMNRMLQQLQDPGATVETVADRFIAERGEVWRPWLGLNAADVTTLKTTPAQ
jgi:glycine betaine/proline transport system substrate-binding protein